MRVGCWYVGGVWVLGVRRQLLTSGMTAPVPSLFYNIISSVSARSSRSAKDPRPGCQCEDTRHSGHLRQLVLLLRRTGTCSCFFLYFVQIWVPLIYLSRRQVWCQQFSNNSLNMETKSTCWLHKRASFFEADLKRFFCKVGLWLGMKYNFSQERSLHCT